MKKGVWIVLSGCFCVAAIILLSQFGSNSSQPKFEFARGMDFERIRESSLNSGHTVRWRATLQAKPEDVVERIRVELKPATLSISDGSWTVRREPTTAWVIRGRYLPKSRSLDLNARDWTTIELQSLPQHNWWDHMAERFWSMFRP
jgi:hypothetical protein